MNSGQILSAWNRCLDGRTGNIEWRGRRDESQKGAIRENVDKSARIMTDEFPSYVGIGTDFEGGHETVNHGEKEYVRGDAHVNGAESYFALLKRGIHGTFHHVSKKHLPLGICSRRMPSTVMDDIDTLILAGGKGTRLAGALPEGLPKCMADIN